MQHSYSLEVGPGRVLFGKTNMSYKENHRLIKKIKKT